MIVISILINYKDKVAHVLLGLDLIFFTLKSKVTHLRFILNVKNGLNQTFYKKADQPVYK